MPEVIEVYFDPQALFGGIRGAYRARLQNNHGIHDVGASREDAVAQLVITAAAHGYSASPDGYQVVRLEG